MPSNVLRMCISCDAIFPKDTEFINDEFKCNQCFRFDPSKAGLEENISSATIQDEFSPSTSNASDDDEDQHLAGWTDLFDEHLQAQLAEAALANPHKETETFVSTADSWNRLRDKERVERLWGLKEFGDPDVELFSATTGELIAKGYTRMVYGDHGPYLELSSSHIHWPAFQLNTFKHETRPMRRYDEWFTADQSVMLYHQRQTVKDRPNPPSGPYSVKNNRPDGYADYRIGRYYLSPDQIQVRLPCFG